MPANFKKLVYPTISLVLMVLVGCSRDNPLSVPSDYIEPEELSCEVILPEEAIITNIDISNVVLQHNLISEDPITGFDHSNYKYISSVDFLVNNIVVTPTTIETPYFERPQELSEDVEAALYVIETSVNDTIIDTDNLNQNIKLTKESTNINVKAKYTYIARKYVQDGASCTPVYERDLNGRITNKQSLEDIVKTVTYQIVINRKSNTGITTTALELPSELSETNDQFGFDISLGYTLASSSIGAVVSAPHKQIVDNDNNLVANAGAVYLYTLNKQDEGDPLSETFWDLSEQLIAAQPDAGDKFGHSISISNGLIAISAPGEDSFAQGVYPWIDENADGENDNGPAEVSNTANSSGAVYLFKQVEDDEGVIAWQQIAFIKQPSMILGLNNYDIGFGEKVLLQDNLLLISAPKQMLTTSSEDDAEIVSSGVVYAYRFDKVMNTLTYITTIKPINPSSNQQFGQAISIFNDSIIIGAPGENNGAGGAHLYNPAGHFWEHANHFMASNANEEDGYGASVALNDNTLFIGASKEDSAGKNFNRNKNDNSLKNSGAVYGYSRNSSTTPWTEFVYIKSDLPQINAQFGYSINFDDNILIIGEPLRQNVNASGKAYTYELNDKELTLINTETMDNIEDSIDSDNQQLNTLFGNNIAHFESVFAFGANGFTNKASGINKDNSGKVYISQ